MESITDYRAVNELPVHYAWSLSDYVKLVEQIATEWRDAARARYSVDRSAGSEATAGIPLDKAASDLFPGEIVPWFRGVTNSDYACEPGLLREADPIIAKFNDSREHILKLETYMFRRFKAAGLRFEPAPRNQKLDWVFLMQHYGLPTRLLDWSKHAFIALYFALRNHALKGERDAAVWVLHPRRLNAACGLGWSIADPHDERERKTKINDYLLLSSANHPLYPLPLLPPHVSQRLAAQHSRFTLHTDMRDGLVNFARHAAADDGRWYVIKIIIPWHAQQNIFRSLRLFGMTEPEIMPGLDSLAAEIRQRIALGVEYAI